MTLIATLALSAAPASAIPAIPAPKVMAALGDSITRGFNSAGFEFTPGICPTLSEAGLLDCPKNSFSTGTNPAVNSQFQRIEAIHPEGPDPVAYNYAFSGARVGTPDHPRPIDLLSQARRLAAEQDPDYVTIEIGANDACHGTLQGKFRNQVKKSLKTLVKADPQVYIQLLSIPDINQLHTLFTSTSPPDPNAILRWSPQVFNVCQALLADPLSSDQADVERRAAFRARVIAYNGALANVCAKFKRCLFDNNAVFNSTFTTADVATVTNTGALPGVDPFDSIPVFGPGAIPGSTADHFHPSLQGQASLAETSWNATFPMN